MSWYQQWSWAGAAPEAEPKTITAEDIGKHPALNADDFKLGTAIAGGISDGLVPDVDDIHDDNDRLSGEVLRLLEICIDLYLRHRGSGEQQNPQACEGKPQMPHVRSVRHLLSGFGLRARWQRCSYEQRSIEPFWRVKVRRMASVLDDGYLNGRHAHGEPFDVIRVLK